MLNERGISIIGTVFTLIILGVMGAALVGLVATDQESRMRVLRREYAFYAVQAGLEYALREIREGGYPIVTDKTFGAASLTTTIDTPNRRITARGVAGSNVKTHSITTAQLAKDCMTVNMSGAALGGVGGNQIQNVILTQACLNAVTIDKMSVSWTPDIGEKVKEIVIGGVEVYEDINGLGSGQQIDITDYKLTGSAVINRITFSSGMAGKNVVIWFTFTDSSVIGSAQKQF